MEHLDPEEAAQQVISDTEAILGDARHWMHHFLNADSRKNEVITDLLAQLKKGQEEISQLNRDLAAERKSRNHFQVEAERIESTLGQLERKIKQSAFIAVLVDGDGAKFADTFLQDRDEGGARAASALRQAIRDYLYKHHGDLDASEIDASEIPIMTRIYANLSDLAKSLYRSNVIQRDEDMKIFAEHITNSASELDFVNVGRGKENADSKIRKMLAHYHKDVHCKKIFMVCCHDNGYLHDLREYGEHNKIVLVETTRAEPYFKTLGFPITRFDEVFRSKPLDNESKHNTIPVKSVQPVDPKVLPTRQPSFPQQSQLENGHRAMVDGPEQQPVRYAPTPASTDSQQSPVAGPAEIETASRTPGIVNSGKGGTSITYAVVGGPANDHQNIVLKAAKMKKQPKTILYNADGRRVDPPTKHPANSPAQSSYQAKLEKISPNAFCNDHYLVGACRRSTCDRVHNIELNPLEVAIHRYKARTSVCPRGPECDDYDCYLSHHCLKDPRCPRGSACKFAHTDYGNLHLDTNEKLQPATRWTQGSDFPEHLQ